MPLSGLRRLEAISILQMMHPRTPRRPFSIAYWFLIPLSRYSAKVKSWGQHQFSIKSRLRGIEIWGNAQKIILAFVLGLVLHLMLGQSVIACGK
jgi:hypothetical protein